MSIIQMLIAQMFSGEDVGDIGHSLRFRGSASAYLNRTITTDATTTYFAAVKRGKLGAVSPIFDTNIKFNANDTLTAFGLTTTAVFRDTTSWLFIHVSNGGLYVNGVSFGAVTTSALTNPRIGFDGTNYFDGYIARLGCVAGSSSAYTNFGYFNTNINEWVSKSQTQVKAVVDAGGTNSFMLDFDDGTSLTTLGYDKSSKGNDWTLNNISLTAGTTYDHMLDVPGNSYCTLNPLGGTASKHAISQGNLSASLTTATDDRMLHGTVFASSGKWYFEYIFTGGSSVGSVGIATNTAVTSGGGIPQANSVIYFGNGGIYRNATNLGTFATYTINDVIGVAFDLDGLTVALYKNNTLVTTVTGVTADSYSIGAFANNLGDNFAVNAGQRPFAYTPPTGFLALNQANLSAPAISNPETNFDVVLDTGANIKTAAEAVFPSNFLEWIKDRANANNHQLLDTVRGSSVVLQSNTAAVETTYAAPSGSSAGWVWKAGGTPVSNTDGSITSSVSANQEAGFSIVSYTGTGVNATVGHGLGVVPKMVIVKKRSSVNSWAVFNKTTFDSSAARCLFLNTTDAWGSYSDVFNSTAPTSTVFSIGTSSSVNGGTAIAYCFAEIEGYSKIGSYTGNNSADGPFVHCGFKPKFVLVKRADSAADWQVLDAVRNTANVANAELNPNLSSAESTVTALDLLATGFKLRTTDTGYNASGGTYIFMAFADVSNKYSLAR